MDYHRWTWDSVFYHICPLGLRDAPQCNDFTSPHQPRCEHISGWLDHLKGPGVNTLYLGPLFDPNGGCYITNLFTLLGIQR